MAIKSVWIDEGCIACGECETICSDVFVVTDTCEVKLNVNLDAFTSAIEESADNCPVSVIVIET